LARRTELSGRAPGRVWISLTDTATRLRFSRSGFLGLVQREGIAITQRHGGRGVSAAELDAFLERCRIAPESYGPELVPYKGHNSPAEVRHLDLFDAVAAGLWWRDARLLERSVSTPTRWHAGGRPGSRTATCRHYGRFGRQPAPGALTIWTSPLCCRGAAAAGWSRPGPPSGVAVMGSGEGPVRLLGRRPHRLSGRRSR
jgi:hypothetical protein